MFSHKRVFKNLRIDLVKTNSVKLKSIMIGWSCKQRFAFKVSLSYNLPITKILKSDPPGGIETNILQDKTVQLGRHVSILSFTWFIVKT